MLVVRLPLRVRSPATNRTTLGAYEEREGRLGLMLFTYSDDTWTNQKGEMVKVGRGSLIRYAGKKS